MGKKFDWKKTVAALAPTVATALGSPLAGMGVSILAEALGVEADEKVLANVIAKQDPETVARIQEAENKLTAELARLDIDLEAIHQQDRASARRLGIERGTVVQTILSAVLSFAFAWVLVSIFDGSMDIEDSMRDIAIYALGTLNTLLVQVFNYWFGSSSGSRDKSKTLEKALR